MLAAIWIASGGTQNTRTLASRCSNHGVTTYSSGGRASACPPPDLFPRGARFGAPPPKEDPAVAGSPAILLRTQSGEHGPGADLNMHQRGSVARGSGLCLTARIQSFEVHALRESGINNT